MCSNLSNMQIIYPCNRVICFKNSFEMLESLNGFRELSRVEERITINE